MKIMISGQNLIKNKETELDLIDGIASKAKKYY